MGLSWNATQLIMPVSFLEPVTREHNWNTAVLTDSAHTAEGELTTVDWSSWLNDTKTRTWNALGKDRHQWKFIRWQVSLFFLIRRAKRARHAWPWRDWRRENASLVSRVCSTLTHAFTPLTKSEEKESLRLIDPIVPLPPPNTLTFYSPIPISWNRDLLYLSSESPGFLYLFCSKTHAS